MNIILNNVQISFPSLFEHEMFGGQSTERYAATFLLDPTTNKKEIEELQKCIKSIIQENKVNIPGDKLCLQNGNTKSYDGYQGKLFIKASNKTKPLVVNRDKTEITDPNIVYAGCFVNAVISLWYQSNQYGKRVNASLIAVQFKEQATPFGSNGSKAKEEALQSFKKYDDNCSIGSVLDAFTDNRLNSTDDSRNEDIPF